MLSTSVKAIQLLELDTVNLPLAFGALDADGLSAACFMLNVTNASDNVIYLSFDGVTIHEIVPAQGAGEPAVRLQLATQTNSQPKAQEALFAKGLIIYVRSATANAGDFAISGYYV